MSINPHPAFKPSGGRPKAASATFPFPHRNLAEVLRDERQAHGFGKCRRCKGTSPLWKIGHCCLCNNAGTVRP